MDYLRNFFEKEKRRVKDLEGNFDVYYNKKDSAMRYFNKDGALTVVIDFEKGTEDFYYKDANDKTSGKGALMRQHENYGKSGAFNHELMSKCPQVFIDLCMDFQRNREAIGIDERPTQAQKKNKGRESREFER